MFLSSMNAYQEVLHRNSFSISRLLASITPTGTPQLYQHRGEIVQDGILQHEQWGGDVREPYTMFGAITDTVSGEDCETIISITKLYTRGSLLGAATEKLCCDNQKFWSY
jgi:hypothetical protein